MLFIRRRVPVEYRRRIAKACPGLDKNPGYWRLFAYLRFGSFFDTDPKTAALTSDLVIPNELLAAFEGKESLCKHRHFRGKQFLDEFSKDVFPIEFSGWVRPQPGKPGRSRRITKIAWTSEVDEVHNQLLSGKFAGGDVYLDDGTVVTRKRRKDSRASLLAVAMANTAKARWEVQTLVRLLNCAAPNAFKSVIRHLPEAEKLANSLPEPIQSQQLRILSGVRSEAMPFYKPVDRSLRIFPLTENLLCLKREIRKTLTLDWLEFDLATAQLAINAWFWGVNEVVGILEKGEDVWRSLADHVGVPLTPDTKAALKDAVYAFCYCEARTKTNAKLCAALGIDSAGEAFFSHPIIVALLRGRRKMVSLIRKRGGMKNVYGEWIDTKHEIRRKDGTIVELPYPPSILAQLAQAVELKLLWPVVELAMKNKGSHGFAITLWQHDGFSIRVHRKAERARWAAKIKAAVNAEADRLGVPTHLEDA